MNSFHELSFPEQREIQEAIATAWAESAELGAVATPDAPAPAKTTTIHHFLGYRSFPDDPELPAEQAEAYASRIVSLLQKRGLTLHGARWLGPNEYYLWLLRDFLPMKVRANVAPHRPLDLVYTQLVPDSVDNIFRTIEAFTGTLTRLKDAPEAKWLNPDDPSVIARWQRYIAAWQSSFLKIQVTELRPLSVQDYLVGNAVRLNFALSYEATLEDRTTTTFTGRARAELVLIDGDYQLRQLHFPGFALR